MNKSQKLKSGKSRKSIKTSRIKYGGMNRTPWGSQANIEKCMPSDKQIARIIELDKKVAKLEKEQLELEAEKNTALEDLKRLMHKMKNWCKSKINSGQLSFDSFTGATVNLLETSESKKRARTNISNPNSPRSRPIPTPPPLNRSHAKPAPAGRWSLKDPTNE